MNPPNLQLSSLSTPSVPRVEKFKKQRKHRTKKHKTTFHTTAPAHNTRSQTQSAETPPASRIIACTQLARLENKTQKGQASTVETTIAQLENDIHQDLAVMDTDTGKLLNYRQLMRKPKNKLEHVLSK